jgi:hypothetical protein
MDQQISRRPWSVDLAIGFTHRTFMKGCDRVCLTRVSLVDPGSAGRQGVVGACVHSVTRDRALAQLSTERPCVELRPGVVLDKEVHLYLMRLGGCWPVAGEVVVRFEGYILPMCLPDMMEEELEDDTSEEVEVEEDYEYEEPVDPESGYGDDGSDEDEEGEDAESMDGIMRVEAVERQKEGHDKQILVLYRYTRFSTALDGALEERGRTKEYQLRCIVPPTGDTARSLLWAGASLAYLVYPGSHLRKKLQELWSSLIAKWSVPPRAASVEVFVHVGILRPADSTPDSMERMRDALKGMVTAGWRWHIGMELHLPEPVRCAQDEHEATNDDKDGCERLAKRRRMVAGEEDCPVCLQLLEGGDLAAWPGCGKPHVFHGRCLERVLRESDMCPICRRLLYIEPKPIDSKE